MITVVIFLNILILCLLLKMIGVSYDFLSILFVGLTSIFIIIYIIYNKDTNKYKGMLIMAFIIRVICMLIDLYFFRLPNAGADDDGFYNTSVQLFNGIISIRKKVYGNYFSKLLYILYLFIGPNRIGAQFTSVMFSMMSIIYIIKIFNKLNLEDKSKNLGITIICFMPNVIFLNSMLRRDTLITLLVVMSINEIVDWYNNKNFKNVIMALFYAFLASMLHSAIIFVMFAYLICVYMYDRKKREVKLITQNIIKLSIIVILLAIVGVYYFTNFETKFSGFTDAETVYESVSKTRGGSAYLTNVKIKNFYQLILFSPFKFIYFLFSPMPWDWRGMADIFTFVLDSSVYIYLFYVVLKNKKNGISQILYYTFLIVTLVFSLGTFTAGTATRHRYNVLPFILISACYLLSEREKEEMDKNVEKYIS